MPITRRMIGPQIVHQEYSASNRRPNPIEALKNEEFESYLVGHLGDDDPIIRSSAKELLLNFRSSKAVKLLLDVVNGSSSNKARMNAIWVLGELGAYDKELIIPYSVEDLLIRLLKENSDMAIH